MSNHNATRGSNAFRFYRWAEEVARLDLTPSAKLVASTLAGHANSKTGKCCPSQKTIARETGLNVRTVERAVRALYSAGYLDSTHGRGNRCSYTLSLPEPTSPKPSMSGLEPTLVTVPTDTGDGSHRNYEGQLRSNSYRP